MTVVIAGQRVLITADRFSSVSKRVFQLDTPQVRPCQHEVAFSLRFNCMRRGRRSGAQQADRELGNPGGFHAEFENGLCVCACVCANFVL